MAIASILYVSNLDEPADDTPIVGVIKVGGNTTNLNISGTQNTVPDGTAQNTTIPIRVSGTRRYGITARHIVIYRLVGTAPNQFRNYRRIVVPDPAKFVEYLSDIPSSIEYEGQDDWILVGGRGESYHLQFAT